MRPNLSRSKSTDGIARHGRSGVKRNNRSYTKLTGLQPLTKTMLSSSLSRQAGPFAPLTKTVLNQSLKLRKTTLNLSSKGKGSNSTLLKAGDRKSSGSLKGMAPASAGLKTSSKRGRAILKLNEDNAYDEYEDLSADSAEGVHAITAGEFQLQFQPQTDSSKEALYSTSEGEARNLEDKRVEPKSKFSEVSPEYHEKAPEEQNYLATDSSTDDLTSKNMYGGSMLLSQSTGLIRKLDPSSEAIGYASSVDEGDLLKNALDKSSGIVFMPKEDRAHETEPAVTRTNVSSYQPGQTIFSNLQRNDSQFVSSMKQQRQQPSQTQTGFENGKNFASYLNSSAGKSNGHNAETRTQQRLWLQRENSLMDVATHLDANHLGNFSNLSLNKLMFAHNYNNSMTNIRDLAGTWQPSSQNLDHGAHGEQSQGAPDHSLSVTNLLYLIQSGHQNSIQSRTEFERLNREYVNVRRHLNPIAEALNRIEKQAGERLDLKKTLAKKKSDKSYGMSNANTFKDFSPNWEKKKEETTGAINRLWQEALLLSSSSSVSLKLYQQQEQLQQQQQQQQRQIAEHYSQKEIRPSYRGTPSSARVPAPATRAVKLAAQAAAEGSTSQR